MEIINANLIVLDLALSDKESIIRTLAQQIEQEQRLNDYEAYVSEVLHRESLTSTGIGYGIAIPHGKCQAVDIPSVALCRLQNPVDWESLDGSPVQIVFLLAVPEAAANNHHLKILAALSRKLLDDAFRRELCTSTDKESLLNLLTKLFANALQ